MNIRSRVEGGEGGGAVRRIVRSGAIESRAVVEEGAAVVEVEQVAGFVSCVQAFESTASRNLHQLFP